MIFELLATYSFLSRTQLTDLTGRLRDTIQHRVRPLYQAGFLNRQRDSEYDDYTYWLDRKGAEIAAAQGWIPYLRWTHAKSKYRIVHDLGITDFHIAYKGVVTKWEQWPDEVSLSIPVQPFDREMVEQHPNKTRRTLVLDGYFEIGSDTYLLENGVATPHCYKGMSDIDLKILYYGCDDFREAFEQKFKREEYRVLYLFPTLKRIENLFNKWEDISRKHWFADMPTALKNPLGEIWRTRRDLDARKYSVIRQEAHT